MQHIPLNIKEQLRCSLALYRQAVDFLLKDNLPEALVGVCIEMEAGAFEDLLAAHREIQRVGKELA
jgi:hypothetical protein